MGGPRPVLEAGAHANVQGIFIALKPADVAARVLYPQRNDRHEACVVDVGKGGADAAENAGVLTPAGDGHKDRVIGVIRLRNACCN